MIPGAWQPVHRPGDDERVGYLDEQGRARTLLGLPLATAPGEDPRDALDERGLREVDGRWWARLPDHVVPGLEIDAPEDGWSWRPVVVAEAAADVCWIRLELAPPQQLQVRLRLPVPVGELLRRERA